MYDIIIIGGGPGGYVAAIRAAQLGAKVALIEKDTLGGVCLNWGCIPTKALLESAELYYKMQNSSTMGIHCSNLAPDMEKIVIRSRKIVDKLTKGVQYLMDKNEITVYKGHGRIFRSYDAKKIVSINNKEQIACRHLIIATGASNRSPESILVDGDRVWDCRHAMMARSIPKSLLIIGAGAIGIEFASFFNALGTEVTVVEYADKILSYADDEIIKWSTNAFKKAGIKFILGTCVESIEIRNNKVVAKTKDSGQDNGQTKSNEQSNEQCNEFVADRCLVATGIIANTNDLGLQNAPGVSLDRGHIITGVGNVTGEPGIYAIGDVITSGPWLAHKAMQDGMRCVEQIMNYSAHGQATTDVDSDRVPICVYSMPQIAQIGLTEDQARASGKEISVGVYPLSANGKALTENNDGLIKVILEKETQIFLGAHMVGAHVTELIQGYGLMQSLEATGEDIHRTIFPHPTLSETLQEAVLAALGHAIHL